MSDSVPPPLARDPAASPELRRAVSLLKESVPEGYDPEANWAGVASAIQGQRRRMLELWVLLAAALVLGLLAIFVPGPDPGTTQAPNQPPHQPTGAIQYALGALGLLLAGVGLGRWWRSKNGSGAGHPGGRSQG